MAFSPDSSSTVVRRQWPFNSQSAAAARPWTSPRPVLPQPSPPGSASTRDEPSSSSEAPRPPLPRVAVPTFPESKRPQGQTKRNADGETPSPRHHMTKKVRHGITVKEKLQWLKMQDAQPDLGNRALAKLAKVQPCQIRDWKKLRERLEVASSCRRRLVGSGRKAKYLVLAFDAEGRAIDFEVWVDDLQLFLQCDRADGLSLFDLTSGASPAPAADANPTVRSQWATRDAAARLAVRRHLPTTERAHFSQYKSAQTLYDAVVARYSSPATAALSRLMLPYLFPDLAAFPTGADLITHLRTSDTRYRAALPAEFCAKNPPPHVHRSLLHSHSPP
ncbi:unnamed protein product [Closterium sp. NIES-64]|nr:unnamed protein product [Closterium sp. NIES-64]